MNRKRREHFDRLLESVLASLPRRIRALLDEAPLIVEDEPDPALLVDLGMDPETETLCGLHSGPSLTERSVLDPADAPEVIFLFRTGIVDQAGGWEAGDGEVAEEIRITLLHEIGHHFGLEEDDLDALGYG